MESTLYYMNRSVDKPKKEDICMRTVKKILAEVSGVDYEKISNSTHLFDDLDLNESDIEAVRSELETYYDIEIVNWDNDEVQLVRDVVILVRDHIQRIDV